MLQPSDAQKRIEENRWQTPKRHAKMQGTPANVGAATKAGGDLFGGTEGQARRGKPVPSQTTVGDYLKPSAFVQAERLRRTGGTADLEAEESDNEDWVEDFEARYVDVCRLPTKEKHQKAARWSTPRQAKKVAEGPSSGGTREGPSRAGAAPCARAGAEEKADCECCVMEVVYPDETELLTTGAEVPQFTKLKVALDSGAGAHVINKRDAPGYQIQPSAMSKAGAAFLAADGGRIPNYGEVTVSMLSCDSSGGTHRISSRFEAADVTRALWSVGLICDSGLDVQFSAEKALVIDKTGQEVCVFHRTNGLYVAEVQVENPMHQGFQRHGH